MSRKKTRPSVNYAKDWLGQLFLIPGLEKNITYGCDHCDAVLGLFQHGDKQPNERTTR